MIGLHQGLGKAHLVGAVFARIDQGGVKGVHGFQRFVGLESLLAGLIPVAAQSLLRGVIPFDDEAGDGKEHRQQHQADHHQGLPFKSP